MQRRLFFLLLFLTSYCRAQIILTDTNARYFQDFNNLDSVGTAATNLPGGWSFYESGSASNTTYRAGTGSATTSDTYSFGSLRSRDRALGSLASGTLTRVVYGAVFVNHTGGDINGFRLAYRGEQWRRGGSGAPDSLRFYFTTVHGRRLSDSGSTRWSEVPELCFSSVATMPNAGTLNGNDSCRTLAATVPLMLHPGDTLLIRWCDLNAAGSDDGLAIDSVSIFFQNGPVLAGNHPRMISFSPDSTATGLTPRLSLLLRFDRAVTPGSGKLYLRDLETQTTDTVLPSDGQLRNSGREVLFAGLPLQGGKGYEVRFDSSAFDSSGFPCIGLYDDRWHFRVDMLGVGGLKELQSVRLQATSGGKLLISSAVDHTDLFSLRIYDTNGRLQYSRLVPVSPPSIIVDPALPMGRNFFAILENAHNLLSTRICRLE